MSNTVSDDDSSTVSGTGGSTKTTAGGGASTEQEVGLHDAKEEDWVAVQRKKKSSSRTDVKVRQYLNLLDYDDPKCCTVSLREVQKRFQRMHARQRN